MLEPGSPVVIGVMPGLRPAVVECASEIAELLGAGSTPSTPTRGRTRRPRGAWRGWTRTPSGGTAGFPPS